jgi:hypothetical protein
MTLTFPTPKPSLFWWALAQWLASLAILALAQHFDWARNPRWYIFCLFILPWHILLALGLVSLFPRRLHALWIAPALLLPFAVGCWLMAFALLAYQKTSPRTYLINLLDITTGADREACWITLYTLPCAIVPIAFYLLWPRIPPEVTAPVCSHCHYDLRGSAASARCPECGKTILRGTDFPDPIIE